MLFYQPEEEFHALPDGKDMRIRHYDRASRWFTIGKHLYFGCDDLARWHCKNYQTGRDDCSVNLFRNIYFDYILQIYCKIPEFDEFDRGDHSFVYFILSSKQQADQMFDQIKIRLLSIEYTQSSALHTPCVMRRGLLDLSLDTFAIYEKL